MTVAGGAGADGVAGGEKVPVAPVLETRVALGLLLAPVRSDVRAQTPLEEGIGLMVARVLPGSPAEAAGLLANDLLFRCDDKDVVSDEDIRRAVTPRKAGDEVKLTWLRRGKEMSAAVKLAAMEIPVASEAASVDSPEHRRRLEELFGRLSGDAAATAAVHRMLIGERGAGGKPGPLAAGELEREGSWAVKEDDSGKLKIYGSGGGQMVEVHDRAGTLQFRGPCGTEAEVAKIPEPWRAKVVKFREDLKAVGATNP